MHAHILYFMIIHVYIQGMIGRLGKLLISCMHFVCFRFCPLCSKLESVGQYLWGVKHYDTIHSSINLETACYTACIHIRRFESIWLSVWGLYSGSEKNWMCSVVITKARLFGSITLIFLIGKELPNFLVRLRWLLTMIPVSQSGP